MIETPSSRRSRAKTETARTAPVRASASQLADRRCGNERGRRRAQCSCASDALLALAPCPTLPGVRANDRELVASAGLLLSHQPAPASELAGGRVVSAPNAVV